MSLKHLTANDIKHRALSIIACLYRADMEEDDYQDFVEKLAELKSWIQSCNLLSYMDDFEQELIFAGHEQISDEILTNVSWLEERVVVFAWVLGFIKTLPPYDRQLTLNESHIFDDFGFLSPHQDASNDSVLLSSEYKSCLDYYETIAVCLRKALNNISTPDLRKSDFGKESCNSSNLTIKEGELCIFGTTLSKATKEMRTEAYSIARERYHAFAWLAGINQDELLV